MHHVLHVIQVEQTDQRHQRFDHVRHVQHPIEIEVLLHVRSILFARLDRILTRDLRHSLVESAIGDSSEPTAQCRAELQDAETVENQMGTGMAQVAQRLARSLLSSRTGDLEHASEMDEHSTRAQRVSRWSRTFQRSSNRNRSRRSSRHNPRRRRSPSRRRDPPVRPLPRIGHRCVRREWPRFSR